MIINRDDTETPISLSVDSGGGVPGLTVTTQIRDNSDATSYLDFDDNTFKTSGWVQKAVSLADIGAGHYEATYDFTSVTNLPASDHLILEYDIDGAVVGIASSIISFEVTDTISKLLTRNFWLGNH